MGDPLGSKVRLSGAYSALYRCRAVSWVFARPILALWRVARHPGHRAGFAAIRSLAACHGVARERSLRRRCDQEKTSIWGLIDSTTLNGEELVIHIEKHLPQIRQLIDLWQHTLLNRFALTTIGIAIGHSNLVRLCKLNADLKIWIK